MPTVRTFRFIRCLLVGLLGSSLQPSLAGSLELVETEAGVTVSRDGQIVLVYNKQSPPLPAGIDPVYRRSGFLHPVMTPKGKTVTDTFPKDHPHQHGIFSAWVKASYGEHSVDFWNLAGRTGSVAHQRVVKTFQDDRCVGFEVDLVHRAEEPVSADVLRERWKITIYETSGAYHCFDIESLQEAVSDTPLVVHQYHYGGMALRGNSRWLSKSDKDASRDSARVMESSSIVNDLGQERIAGNHVPARWIALTGTLDQENALIAMLGHPKNFGAPQPARLHPTKPYFCFSPCVSQSFEISQANPLRARYRYLVTDNLLDPAWIDEQWNKLAHDAEP